ncbi:hypothetical protein BDD12DRAFT_10373 [Trichophaea hybrida]|nr:hypothetical protein BDD12DRAFT_10373 [Trichophaea hybrida]
MAFLYLELPLVGMTFGGGRRGWGFMYLFLFLSFSFFFIQLWFGLVWVMTLCEVCCVVCIFFPTFFYSVEDSFLSFLLFIFPHLFRVCPHF